MKLPQDIYPSLESISWLSTVGHESRPAFDFPMTYAVDRSAALRAFNSDLWADAKTEAQGDLTGYLSKHHSSAYGGHWNILATESRALVESAIHTKLVAALREKNLAPEMFQVMLIDLNRAVLEVAYRRKFPEVPVFFERLLQIYKAGRIPCGWSGRMQDWPVGRVMVF